MADAKREDETVESDAPPLVNRLEQLLDTCLAPTLAILQRCGRCLVAGFQCEDVMRPLDQFIGIEFGDDLVTQALNVEGIARGEMLQALDALRRADQPTGAAPYYVELAGAAFLAERV